MRTVNCRSCDHTWTLNKPLEDYQQGPRCSECGSYEIETVEVTKPTYARAFESFIEGGKPHEAVADNLAPPEEIDQLWEQYCEMADKHAGLREEIETDLRNELTTELEAEIQEEMKSKYLVGLPCAECGDVIYIDTERKRAALEQIIRQKFENDEHIEWIWCHRECNELSALEEWASEDASLSAKSE